MPLSVAKAFPYSLAFAATLSSASFCDTQGEWTQVWQDEFDQATLDNSSWTIDLGAGDSRVRNSQGTSDNVYLEDGKLVLRSQRQKIGNYNLTSGAVQTQNKKFFKGPARFCVAAILPGGGPNGTVGNHAGDGVWPAHWLMPNTQECWPTNGEIDIMEMINGDGVLHGTYHWSDNGCGKDSSKGGQTKMPIDWASAYHEYAVEYTADYIAFVVDGQVYENVTKDEATIYDVPQYIILNTALGGPWPEPVDNNTVMPTHHKIDYVRVAQKKSKRRLSSFTPAES